MKRPFCHPEHIRFAQGKLREGSVSSGVEMLPLRCAQGFGSRAQQDNDPLSRTVLHSLNYQEPRQ